MKGQGYPHGIVWAVLGRARTIERQQRIPHAAALERAVSEFTRRSSIADRERARAEIEDLLAQASSASS